MIRFPLLHRQASASRHTSPPCRSLPRVHPRTSPGASVELCCLSGSSLLMLLWGMPLPPATVHAVRQHSAPHPSQPLPPVGTPSSRNEPAIQAGSAAYSSPCDCFTDAHRSQRRPRPGGFRWDCCGKLGLFVLICKGGGVFAKTCWRSWKSTANADGSRGRTEPQEHLWRRPASGRRPVGWGRLASFGDRSGSGRVTMVSRSGEAERKPRQTREDALGGPGQDWRGALEL